MYEGAAQVRIATPNPRMNRPEMLGVNIGLRRTKVGGLASDKLINCLRRGDDGRTNANNDRANKHAATTTEPVSDGAGNPWADETTDCV